MMQVAVRSLGLGKPVRNGDVKSSCIFIQDLPLIERVKENIS